jgi:hypothetical protein
MKFTPNWSAIDSAIGNKKTAEAVLVIRFAITIRPMKTTASAAVGSPPSERVNKAAMFAASPSIETQDYKIDSRLRKAQIMQRLFNNC